MLVISVNPINRPKYIINFPTKAHWRNPSQLSWIKSGLKDLRNQILHYNITSIALPPLGCGNGGLNWDDVRPEIENALQDLPVDIVVYEPSLEVKTVLAKEEKEAAPRLTPARAMLLHLLYRYRAMDEFCK